jgi:DNA replication protein DnaC
MPELLTQPITPESPVQVAGIKSERWPASNRNGGRHQIGIPGRVPSESTDWIYAHENLVINGPTGVGKSWLACALGHKSCRDNRSVFYQGVPKLFRELALARGDGRYNRISRTLGNVQLLILDDWGLEPRDAQARHDLLEILEERYGRRSTIITSQLPVEDWHAVIGDPTIPLGNNDGFTLFVEF